MTGVITPPDTISVPFPLAEGAPSWRRAAAAYPAPTSATKVTVRPAKKRDIQGALHALYGAGNPQVSDTAIRQHITAPGRTGAQVVQAAIAHGVNLDQITRAMADHEAFRPERVDPYLASAGLDKSTLLAQEVATWTRADVDQTLASLSEHRQRWIAGQGVLNGLLGGVSHLATQAQQAQAHAAERKGQLDALSAQVDQGMAQYQWLLQERAAAQALKAQAQADLTAGQSALASVHEITTRHDRRATATVDAQYQIDAAQARLGQAQQRLDQTQASIATLEAWGLPLLEAQANARAAWEQAAAVAQESSEIANAHTDSAAQQAQKNQALMAQIVLDHDRLVAALATNPDIALAESIRASIADTGNALAQALAHQRSWTDAVLTQGMALHETASALDSQARALGDTLNLKDQLQAHTQAQVQLTEAQQAFEAAKGAVQGAQATLDAAYQARMAANELDSKKGRAHARDEADRRKTWAADELAQAQQRLDAAAQQLKAAQAAAWPTIDQALQAWAPWQALSTQAQETQAQVGQSVALVMLASNLENALQSAAAQTQMQRIGANQAQVLAAQNLAAQQRVDEASLEATWRSVSQDLEQAIATLHSHEQTAADDRVAAENAQMHFVALQAAALGQAHIAQYLGTDAQALHEAANSFALAQQQDTLAQAAQRLADAKLHREVADLRMDWAEARTNAKKQARDIKNASGPREAAEKEWIEAQQAHAQAQAQLASARRLSAPLRSAAQAARIDALAAMHEAERDAGHASAAAVWADAWQTRDQGSSTGLRVAELGVVEGLRALAALQSTLALTQHNDATATRIGEQAAFMQSWANDYAGALTQRHSAQASTRSARRQLDESRIQADATEMFHAFLNERAEQLGQATQQLQGTVMAELNHQWASAAEHARADAHQALQAHQHWAQEDGRIGLEWVGDKLEPFRPDDFLDEADIAFNLNSAVERVAEWVRRAAWLGARTTQVAPLLGRATTPGSPPCPLCRAEHERSTAEFRFSQRSADNTPVAPDPQTRLALAQTLAQQANDQRAQHMQTNPQAVLDAWLETALDQRKDSTRKQLHLLDDLEAWKARHPQLTTLRQAAQRSAQQALASSQRVIDIGQDLQAHALLALTQTQQRTQTQHLLASTAQHSAQLSAHLATHAHTLATQLSAEHAANSRLQSALEDFMEASAHQTERLRAAARTAEPNDASWLLAQADGLARLAQRHEPLAHNTRVIRDALALAAAEAQTQAQADAAQASARQDRAQRLHTTLADTSAELESERAALIERAGRREETLREFYQNIHLAQTAIRGHDTAQARADDIHERRLRADRVHKKRKKKNLFSILVNGAAALVTAALTYFAPPVGLALGEQLLASAAVGAAVSAGAQGINLAAGFQDRFDVKPMIAMGGIAAFGAVMGTVTSTLDKAFQGTILGAEVPGSAATRTLLASSNPLTEEISMALVTQPAVPAIKAGALDWLGTAISWGTGATAGSLARQGLMMATGQQNGIAWDRIHFDAVKQAIGGFLRIHVGSSFASNPFTFTHYRPMGLGDMAIDVAKRVTGTLATNIVLKNVGMLDDIRLSDLLAVGAARAAQVLLRDAMGKLPIDGNATPGAFVSSALGQSIIRTTTVLTNAAIQTAYGQSIDWNNLLYLGVGRVAGQFGTLWGAKQVQGALDSLRSYTQPATAHTQ